MVRSAISASHPLASAKAPCTITIVGLADYLVGVVVTQAAAGAPGVAEALVAGSATKVPTRRAAATVALAAPRPRTRRLPVKALRRLTSGPRG